MKKRVLSFLAAVCLLCFSSPSIWGAEEKELPILATPTELTWGTDYNWGDNTQPRDLVGGTSWKVNSPHQGSFKVTLYQTGNDDPIAKGGSSFDAGESPAYNTTWVALFNQLDSGSYYFTVQSLGDGIQFQDSKVSEPSPIWTYIKPDKQLATAIEPHWDWPKPLWTNLSSEKKYHLSYSIGWYYAKTKDITPQYIGRTGGRINLCIPDRIIQECGEGYYYFNVSILSSDITQYQGSTWSELSPAYHLTSVPTKDGLYNILNDTEIFTPEEIRQAVYDLNTGDLKNALLADQNEPGGTAELLARLEEKTGVAVSTAAEKPEFEEMAAETQIIGAALNDVPDGTDSVTLNIGSPEKEHVIPEQYHNTVALHFSMGLEGVTNQQDLKVPVRVILPIPSTINPAFLVLLHYGQDGSVEAIEQPYKFQKDGKWYVSIVLTHFSDFVMTEEKQAEPSRPSGGSSSSSDDAPTYAITLPKDIAGGSVSVSPKRAEKGDKVTLTLTPEAGHRVKKVTVTDKKGAEIELTRQEDGTYTFLMPGGPVTVSAQFVTRSVEVIPPPPFADVDSTNEEQTAITYVYDKGLMNGTSDTTFEPETETSRAMLITILHRLDGQPAPENRPDFADVPAGEWYSDAVGWAVEKGIVVGFEDNTFRPEELLTKEHLTTILYRYADYKGYDVTQREALSDYIDRDAVSAYAVEAMGWAKAKGLLNMEERMLLPGERVRRRRVADMVMQFCENVIG